MEDLQAKINGQFANILKLKGEAMGYLNSEIDKLDDSKKDILQKLVRARLKNDVKLVAKLEKQLKDGE
jgi:hypothetical protein